MISIARTVSPIRVAKLFESPVQRTGNKKCRMFITGDCRALIRPFAIMIISPTRF